jgi:hypothetical protein
MQKSSVIKLAAWLEIIVGAGLVLDLDLLTRLLFAAEPQGVGGPLGRVAGIALIALGVGGLRSTDVGERGSGVLGLFVYNAVGAIFFAWVAVASVFRGVLLWPAVILHAAMACALLWTSR